MVRELERLRRLRPMTQTPDRAHHKLVGVQALIHLAKTYTALSKAKTTVLGAFA